MEASYYVPLEEERAQIMRKSRVGARVIASVLSVVALTACLVAMWPVSPLAHGGADGVARSPRVAAVKDLLEPLGSADEDRVVVELFVMSKCPDANYCEHFLDKTFRRLAPITHVKTQYIAQAAPNGTLTCKHGDAECAGDAIQLCVQRHTPAGRNHDWFYRFLLCSWDSGLPVQSQDLVESCLDTVGASHGVREKIQECIDSGEGEDLLRESAAEAVRRGVVHSCTVEIEGEQRCIRDGGTWYDCPGGSSEADFQRSICEAFAAKTGDDSELCGDQALAPASGAAPAA